MLSSLWEGRDSDSSPNSPSSCGSLEETGQAALVPVSAGSTETWLREVLVSTYHFPVVGSSSEGPQIADE